MENPKGFKYTLIVSQYYHSRHAILVKFEEDTFLDQARKVVAELEAYKRTRRERKLNLGDLEPEYCGETFRHRYNVNDEGDIYIISEPEADELISVAAGYMLDTHVEGRKFKSQKVKDEINEHHDYDQVRKIVAAHFEIA